MKHLLRILSILALFNVLAGCAPLEKTPEVETVSGITTYHYWNNYDYLNSYFALKVNADAGQTLHVDFTTVINGGSLELKVVSPKNKALWTAKTTNSGTHSADIPMPVGGEYSILIRASKTSGNFDVKYHFNE